MRSKPRSPRRSATAALCSASVALLVLLVAPPASTEVVDGDEASPVERAGLEWLPLESGLARAREARLPILLWYPGETDRDDAGAGDADAGPRPEVVGVLGERRALRRRAERYVRILVSGEDLARPWPAPEAADGAKGDVRDGKRDEAGRAAAGGGARKGDAAGDAEEPPPASERLRVLPGRAALVVLDIRERPLRRWTPLDATPSAKELRGEIERLLVKNLRWRAQERKIDAVLQRSEELFRKGKLREAANAVLPWDDSEKRARLAPWLNRRVEEVLRDYRGRAEKTLRAADRLVEEVKRDARGSARKLAEATRKYDQAARNWPFPDVRRHAQRGKAEVTALIQQSRGQPVPRLRRPRVRPQPPGGR